MARLPVSVKAYTITDEDDNYNIYVNTKISTEEQQKALAHERKHIEKGHFYRNTSAAEDEKEIED